MPLLLCWFTNFLDCSAQTLSLKMIWKLMTNFVIFVLGELMSDKEFFGWSISTKFLGLSRSESHIIGCTYVCAVCAHTVTSVGYNNYCMSCAS